MPAYVKTDSTTTARIHEKRILKPWVHDSCSQHHLYVVPRTSLTLQDYRWIQLLQKQDNTNGSDGTTQNKRGRRITRCNPNTKTEKKTFSQLLPHYYNFMHMHDISHNPSNELGSNHYRVTPPRLSTILIFFFHHNFPIISKQPTIGKCIARTRVMAKVARRILTLTQNNT